MFNADAGMRVVSLDPGGTTGFAYWDGAAVPEVLHLGPQKHHTELWSMLNHYMPTHLIYESFEFRNKSRDNLELISREYIGIAELWAGLNPTKLYRQSAAQGKGFIPDSGPMKDLALKRLGWYEPSKKHGMDAVRHLVYFLCNGPHGREGIRRAILEKGFKG